MNTNRAVITVLGADRSGIVARVASCLAEGGANIVDISQTILDGIFTMTMIVELGEDTASFSQLQEQFEQLSSDLKVQITIQRADIFQFMHRI